MTDEGDVYQRLRKHIDDMPIPYPETRSGVELRILRRLFTPEEAEVALGLSAVPEPVEKIRDVKDPEHYIVTSLAWDPEARLLFYTTDNYAYRDLLSLDPATGRARVLIKDARIGDLIMATSISLVSGHVVKTIQVPEVTGVSERLSGSANIQAGHFITLERWMEKETVKRLLPAEIAFAVCDTETFPLAEIALQRQLPFLAVRSITDRADEEIPRALLKVNDASGSYRFLRAVFLLLSKPRLIPAAIRLGRRGAVASENLWRAFEAVVDYVRADAELDARAKDAGALADELGARRADIIVVGLAAGQSRLPAALVNA